MREQKFCKQCGIELSYSFFGLGRKNFYTFEDGDYCPRCAKTKVDEARKKIK